MSKSNKLTQAILKALQYNGFEAWRQNNIAIKGRRFIGRKGVPDIMGFQRSTGIMIGVEIKADKDKLSPEQIELHNQMRQAGAFVFVAKEFEQFYGELMAHLKES